MGICVCPPDRSQHLMLDCCTKLTDKSSLENSLLVKERERAGTKSGATHSYGRFADWP